MDNNLETQKLLQAHSILNDQLLKADFHNAAWTALAIGEATKQPGYYIQGFNYLINAKMFAEAHQLAAQLEQTDFRTYLPFLYAKVCLSLAENNEQQAIRILQEIIAIDPNQNSAKAMIASAQSIAANMLKCESSIANITAAYLTSKEDRISVKLLMHCTLCDHEYMRIVGDTFFQTPILQCHCCSQPYIGTPQAMKDAVNHTMTTPDENEAIGIDLLLHSWVQKWWKNDSPKEASLFNKNIFQLSYFTLRYKLGEIYSVLHCKDTSSQDTSRSDTSGGIESGE